VAAKFLGYMKIFLQGASPKNDTASRRFFILTTYLLIFSVGIFIGKLFSENEGRISRDLLCQVKENQLVDFQKKEALLQQEEASRPIDPEAPVFAAQPKVEAVELPTTSAPKTVELAPVPAPKLAEPAPAVPTKAANVVAPSRDIAAAQDLKGKYTVQIAVNSTLENAKNAVEKLAASKVNAEFWEIKSATGKQHYLVGSGLFPTIEAAKKHQAELIKNYTPETFIHKFK
jgi:hypothetical protein